VATGIWDLEFLATVDIGSWLIQSSGLSFYAHLQLTAPESKHPPLEASFTEVDVSPSTADDWLPTGVGTRI
jgi:hypothetical protein